MALRPHPTTEFLEPQNPVRAFGLTSGGLSRGSSWSLDFGLRIGDRSLITIIFWDVGRCDVIIGFEAVYVDGCAEAVASGQGDYLSRHGGCKIKAMS